jgi:hypothetical protein
MSGFALRNTRDMKTAGDVEDILKRLGNLEINVTELKSEVSAIRATTPHLATKADVTGVRTALSDLEVRIIKWLVGTLLTAVSAAFTLAKFVH